MLNTKVRPLLVAAAGLVLMLAVSAWLPCGVELTISPVKGGGSLVALPLRAGERFTLHYYHSVENAPIWEEHSADRQGRIYIEEERYLKYGAGMGKMPGVGRMVMKGPYEAIVDMHMPVGEFVLRVGSPGVDHTILWRDAAVNLSRMVPHQAVRFQARPISLLRRLWLEICPRTPQW